MPIILDHVYLHPPAIVQSIAHAPGGHSAPVYRPPAHPMGSGTMPDTRKPVARPMGSGSMPDGSGSMPDGGGTGSGSGGSPGSGG